MMIQITSPHPAPPLPTHTHTHPKHWSNHRNETIHSGKVIFRFDNPFLQTLLVPFRQSSEIQYKKETPQISMKYCLDNFECPFCGIFQVIGFTEVRLQFRTIINFYLFVSMYMRRGSTRTLKQEFLDCFPRSAEAIDSNTILLCIYSHRQNTLS